MFGNRTRHSRIGPGNKHEPVMSSCYWDQPVVVVGGGGVVAVVAVVVIVVVG